MTSPGLFITFLMTSLLFAYIPGPAMFYAAARTVARGRWAGLMAVLGIHLGGYAHVIAASAGLSILLQAVPSLYAAVKLLGAAYLIYLGVMMFRGTGELPRAEDGGTEGTARRAMLESILVEVLNPKTALFFLAFLPQFVDASGGLPVWMQTFLLGAIVNAIFTSADILCVLMAGSLMSRLRGTRHGARLMQRAGGSVLIGLGTHLALQKN